MPNSLKKIPDVWIARISCPICGSPGLEILSSPDQADQIFCHNCNVKLEVEDGGNHLMIAQPPQGISSKVIGRWVSFPELIEIGHRLAEKKNDQKTSPNPAEQMPPRIQTQETPKPAEVFMGEEPSGPNSLERDKARVNELYSLGNSIEQIRTLITDTAKYSPEEIDELMAEIVDIDKGKKKRRNRLIILLVIMILLIAVCAVLIFAWRQYL